MNRWAIFRCPSGAQGPIMTDFDSERDPVDLLAEEFAERCRRGAQAAARLHHSNIVPVFGAGEHEGLHYYVMQFIEGKGLDELLTTWRNPLGGPVDGTAPTAIMSPSHMVSPDGNPSGEARRR